MTITGASTLEDFSPGLRHQQAVRRGRLGVYSLLHEMKRLAINNEKASTFEAPTGFTAYRC